MSDSRPQRPSGRRNDGPRAGQQSSGTDRSGGRSGGGGSRPRGGSGRSGGPAGGQGRGGRDDARTAGERGRSREPGQFDNSERRGGSRLAPTKPRLPDPRIDDDVTGREVDREVRQQLRTLSVENADGVAKHLVMVGRLLAQDNLAAAMAHAETAVRRAGRVPAAREALGFVAYRQGDFAKALTEFRTVRRLSGSSHLLPLMVDCERGLGRPERALELATSPEVRTLADAERIELAIVVSGIRRDAGALDAALVALQLPALRRAKLTPAGARLAYAYADVLLDLGRSTEARDWFAKAAVADTDFTTDAVERLDELDGTVLTDLLEGEDDDEAGDGD